MKKQQNLQGLKIIIVGCGKVGATLAQQLVKEGHDITVIDKNTKRVQSVTDVCDVMGIVGNGASYSVQVEAGINEADLIISVTDSDELNLLCCTVATQVGNCSAIARVRTPDYSKEVNYLQNKLGLAMIINPELEAANEAARILYLPSALEVNPFAHNMAEIVKFKIPEGNLLDNTAIMNLGNRIDNDILICAIERDGEIFIPSGNFVMKAGDLLSFVAPIKHTKNFLKEIGFKTNKVKNTMIIGGGKVAYYLAERLLRRGVSVKIIELDKTRCEELSLLLPKAVIINGDGTDQDLLLEEGIKDCESFVPLTGIDEENILLTLYAKQVSNAKVITKINRITFSDVIDSLDLGSVLYPKYIIAEAIVAYVRAKKDSMNRNIETLYHMFDSRVEAIEFNVTESSSVTDIPLKDLKLKKNLLISLINRNGKVLIPKGQDSIQVGDSVVVVTTHSGFSNITDILL